MEHIVTGCKDCPYLYDWIYCKHPSPMKPEDVEVGGEDFIDFIDGGSPDWCPLNKEPITISKQ